MSKWVFGDTSTEIVYDWRHYAACLDYDAELFFPKEEQHKRGHPKVTNAEITAAAKAVCASCAVREPCLAEAFRLKVDGVWGGTDASDRRKIQRDALKQQRKEHEQHVRSVSD